MILNVLIAVIHINALYISIFHATYIPDSIKIIEV